MRITYDSAINRLAERSHDRFTESWQSNFQRRNKVVDIYGMEFNRQGDAAHPAVFYVSVSPDLIYYERFEFKIIIDKFAIPVAANGISSEVVTIQETSLAVGNTNLNANSAIDRNNNVTTTITPSSHDHIITPNPHGHLALSHSHQISAGMSLFDSDAVDYEIFIEGVNLTPYFKAQFIGNWITGEGVFPSADLSNYDVLKAVGYMSDLEREMILKPGYKRIELRGNGVFNATLVNYLKYSHINR